MTEAYAYWREELRSPGGNPRDTDRPICGFWRIVAAKTKPDYPCAIWPEESGTIVKIGRKGGFLMESPEGDDFRAWSWMKCQAVTDEDYARALETGFWDYGKPARRMTEEERLGIDTQIGGNNAPIEETLADQIAALAEIINGTPEPKTQDQANALAAHLEKMTALLKLADAEFTKDKAPWLEGGRAVDSKWAGVRRPGIEAKADGEARKKAFLRKEQDRINAEVAAENERRAAELARRTAEGAEATQAPPEELSPVQPQRAVAGGVFGRASGLRKVKVCRITDKAALTKHLLDTDDDDFANYLQKRATAAMKGKALLPGTTQDEELQ